MEGLFWKEGAEVDGGVGGYFVRNDLFQFLKTLKNDGKEPIGLRIDGWNIEVIVKEEMKEIKIYEAEVLEGIEMIR